MHPTQLQIKDFTYELPPEKIANYPLQKVPANLHSARKTPRIQLKII